MTRNSQDDLLIFNQLIIEYINFLKARLSKENELLKNEYEKILSSSLSSLDMQYLHIEKEFHIESTKEFMAFLDEIQKKVLDFYIKNQRPLPYYATHLYHANIKKHETEIIHLINSLFKN